MKVQGERRRRVCSTVCIVRQSLRMTAIVAATVSEGGAGSVEDRSSSFPLHLCAQFFSAVPPRLLLLLFLDNEISKTPKKKEDKDSKSVVLLRFKKRVNMRRGRHGAGQEDRHFSWAKCYQLHRIGLSPAPLHPFFRRQSVVTSRRARDRPCVEAIGVTPEGAAPADTLMWSIRLGPCGQVRVVMPARGV